MSFIIGFLVYFLRAAFAICDRILGCLRCPRSKTLLLTTIWNDGSFPFNPIEDKEDKGFWIIVNFLCHEPGNLDHWGVNMAPVGLPDRPCLRPWNGITLRLFFPEERFRIQGLRLILRCNHILPKRVRSKFAVNFNSDDHWAASTITLLFPDKGRHVITNIPVRHGAVHVRPQKGVLYQEHLPFLNYPISQSISSIFR